MHKLLNDNIRWCLIRQFRESVFDEHLMPNYRRGNWISCIAYRSTYMQGATNAKLHAVLIANTQYPLIAGSVERLKSSSNIAWIFGNRRRTFTTGVTSFEADLLITFEQMEPSRCGLPVVD